jgi:hypothetical protein
MLMYVLPVVKISMEARLKIISVPEITHINKFCTKATYNIGTFFCYA